MTMYVFSFKYGKPAAGRRRRQNSWWCFICCPSPPTFNGNLDISSIDSEILEAASELGCANWHMGRTERKQVPPEDSAIAHLTSHLRGKRARLYM